MKRWGDEGMGRWGDGETRGWGDKGMGRQGDGETRGWGEINKNCQLIPNSLNPKSKI
ncbi:MAG: hypothetical protein ACFCUV_28090 [Rivularia sp. (in: cyanobacteria)]